VSGAMLLARSFAPLQPPPSRAHAPDLNGDPLRLGDVATIDPGVSWRSRPGIELLRAAIGITHGGAALVLDLKE